VIEVVETFKSREVRWRTVKSTPAEVLRRSRNVCGAHHASTLGVTQWQTICFEYVHQVAFLDRDKTTARPCWLHGFGRAQCAQHGAPGFNGRQCTVLHDVNERKLATDRHTDEHSPSRTQDGMPHPSTTISKVSTKSPAISHSLSSRAPHNQCFTQQV